MRDMVRAEEWHGDGDSMLGPSPPERLRLGCRVHLGCCGADTPLETGDKSAHTNHLPVLSCCNRSFPLSKWMQDATLGKPSKDHLQPRTVAPGLVEGS